MNPSGLNKAIAAIMYAPNSIGIVRERRCKSTPNTSRIGQSTPENVLHYLSIIII